MITFKNACVALSALALLGLSQAAHAVDPLIQIGGGLETAHGDSSVNVLLRAAVGIHGKESTGQEYVLVRLRGDLAYAQGGAEHQSPYVDVDFIPGQYIFGRFSSKSGAIDGLSISALPMHYARDVRLDESSRLNISLVGVSGGVSQVSTSDLGLYVQFAAQFLGWKTVSHISEMRGFGGFRWAGVGLEAGVKAALSEGLRVRLGVGGQTDMTSSTRTLNATESTLHYSNSQAYVEARVDIADLIQLFARGSINAVVTQEGGADTVVASYTQLMAGVTLFF